MKTPGEGPLHVDSVSGAPCTRVIQEGVHCTLHRDYLSGTPAYEESRRGSIEHGFSEWGLLHMKTPG